MRKHSKAMATRWGCSAYAPQFAHKLANDRGFQFSANALLRGLLKKVI